MQLDGILYVFYYSECASKKNQITEGMPNQLCLISFKGLEYFLFQSGM